MEDFFDRFKNITGVNRYSSSEVVTPLHIVKDMVDLLPSEVFNPDAKFLDPAVKSGRFLAEIYNKLFNSKLVIERFPDEIERKQHILNNQLYGVATSAFAASMVRKQLYDDATIRGNIVYKNEKVSKELIQGAFNIMKFDVVIGNPPYNNDIYLDFVEIGHRLSSKYCCMITPAKWQAKTDGKPKGSKTVDKNEKFRQDIVPYMSKIVFYKDTHDIFDIDDNAGMSYYLIGKDKVKETYVKTICTKNKTMEADFEPHDESKLTLFNHKLLSVIGKVGTLGEGFKQSLYVKNTDHGETSIDGTLGFKRCTFVGETDRGEALKQAGYVEVMQGEKVSGYKKIEDLFTTIGLDKYKVICSIMIGGAIMFGNDTKVIGSPKFHCIGPYQIPKGSFPVIRYFDSRGEAESFISYFETKTVSLLFYLGVCGATITKEFFRYIPNPNNWTLIYEDKALPGYKPDENGIYIDSEGKKHCALYSKYNLDGNDIEIIESIIKERK